MSLPPSDTNLYPTGKGLDFDSPVGVVGEADTQLPVGVGLVFWVRLRQGFGDVP